MTASLGGRVGLAARDREGKPPGPAGLPVIGNTHQWARDRLGFTTRCAREYGDVVRLRLAGRSFYLLNHPDHVKHVLVDNNRNYEKGRFFRRELSFLGNGLLTSEGDVWRRGRHRIEPAFHPDRIAGYAETMTDYAARAVDAWRDGQTRDVHADMSRLTLEIVASALFDVDVREEVPEVGSALAAVMDRFRRSTASPVGLPDWVPTPTNRRYRAATERLDDLVASIVRNRRASGGDAGDVVSMLLAARDEDGTRMSDGRLRDEVMTLFLAGHETTALALTYTCYLLAKHPAVEERLRSELSSVLGGEAPTMADVPDLAYTERVVKESMRLYPPVYAVVREPLTDDEIGGYRIPAGATVSMNQWILHRDPRFFEDPEAFDPDRFAPERERARSPFAYFPFGGGPRRCIGDRFAMLEATLVLATLLQRVYLELPPGATLDLQPAITLRPKSGVDMVVRRR